MNQPPRIPKLEGDFLLASEFPLELGGVLRDVRLHYALYGEINPARDNLILVCHALSGSALVAEWWPAVWAMPDLIDPDQDAILGINILGSCYGTTGPSSLNPATGAAYGPAFPQVTIRDTVRAQALLLDHLGVERLAGGQGFPQMDPRLGQILLDQHAPDRGRRAEGGDLGVFQHLQHAFRVEPRLVQDHDRGPGDPGREEAAPGVLGPTRR